MIEHALWAALIFLIIASALPGQHRNYRFLAGSAGWGFFAIHWLIQPAHYIEIGDYVNVLLVLAVSVFCMIIAHAMYRNYEHSLDDGDVLLTITTAAALGGLFYYPFAKVEFLNTFLISAVAEQVVYILHLFNVPAELALGEESMIMDAIKLNGHQVKIIFACTAIESIAIFIGLIFCVRASAKRTTIAFIASIPVIYVLNLIRDAFVVVAFGYQWFRWLYQYQWVQWLNQWLWHSNDINSIDHISCIDHISFQIAHHVIAKIGSGIALFVIAYVVLRVLPELLDVIDQLFTIVRSYLTTMTTRNKREDGL
ncbi:MAG: archaeosortase A [Methanosarcinales archaeon]|nr:MAG: archaeosortase A [Methanosarcinales archaeon]